MLKRKNQSGFTLLEVAMVLIVASLIVLATIKAQGIWNEAKYFRLERQIQETQVAVALFERKMGFLPGADPSVSPEVIENAGGANSANDWNHDLAVQNLIVSAARAALHPFSDTFWIEYEAGVTPFDAVATNLNLINLANVPIDFAEALTRNLDNGEPNTGSIRVSNGGGGTNTLATWAAVRTANTDGLCDLWIRL